MTDRAPAAAFHARLEEELKKLGHNKAWLAREADVARSTINNWKTGRKPPQAAKVNQVAAVLKIDPAEARRLAGLEDAVVADATGEPQPLSEIDTDVLLAEIRRRIPD